MRVCVLVCLYSASSIVFDPRNTAVVESYTWGLNVCILPFCRDLPFAGKGLAMSRSLMREFLLSLRLR